MTVRHAALSAFVAVVLVVFFQNCDSFSPSRLSSASSTRRTGSVFGSRVAAGVNGFPVDTIFAPSKLGIGEPIFENSFNIYEKDGRTIRYWAWDIDQQVDAMLRLRPSIFRMWVPTGYLFDANGSPKFQPDGTSFDDGVLKIKKIARRFQENHIPILGMDHSFPTWMTGVNSKICGPVGQEFDANWNAVPHREDRARYLAFLQRYRFTWQAVAHLLPEIQAWEPANETNGALAMVPEQSTCPPSAGEKRQFSYLDRVLVTIDLMAQAHAGIKDGQPTALVFMPPPGPVTATDGIMPARNLEGIRDFILNIYQNIAAGNGVTQSRNARDHFDGVSWHPYIFQDANERNWVAQNQAIYDVMQSFGDSSVPVIFSEVGNSEFNWSHDDQREIAVSPLILRDWMYDTITLSRSRLPWLKYLIWFRGIDSPRSLDWGGEGQRRFGILKEWSATNPSIPFEPKPSADTFCVFTNCVHTPLAAGVFKAFINSVGWSLFWFNGSAYCQYTATSYRTLIGRDINSDVASADMRILDVSDYSYVGFCQNP